MSKRKVRYWAMGIGLLIVSTVFLLLVVDRSNIRQNAIATAQYYATSPAQTPSFILQLKPAPGGAIVSGEQICVSLSVGYFWNSNEDVAALATFLAQNTHITINGEFPFAIKSSSSWGGPLSTLPNGKPNADLKHCIEQSLSSGNYSAELKTQDMAGKQYDYTWAFIVK